MITRNFWFEADVDGRNTRLQSGPSGADGGFTVTVYVRYEGSIVTAVHVNGAALSTGHLVLSVVPEQADRLPAAVTVEPLPGNGGFTVRSRR